MDTRERVAGELSRWVHLLFGGRAPEKVVFDVEAGRLCAIFAEEREALKDAMQLVGNAHLWKTPPDEQWHMSAEDLLQRYAALATVKEATDGHA